LFWFSSAAGTEDHQEKAAKSAPLVISFQIPKHSKQADPFKEDIMLQPGSQKVVFGRVLCLLLEGNRASILQAGKRSSTLPGKV
jgi:hypothetical protein